MRGTANFPNDSCLLTTDDDGRLTRRVLRPPPPDGPTPRRYNRAMPLDADLLAILVCPLTRSPLRQEGDRLIAAKPAGAGLSYPVRDGIPVLLIEEAQLPPGVADLDDFRRRYADDIVT